MLSLFGLVALVVGLSECVVREHDDVTLLLLSCFAFASSHISLCDWVWTILLYMLSALWCTCCLPSTILPLGAWSGVVILIRSCYALSSFDFGSCCVKYSSASAIPMSVKFMGSFNSLSPYPSSSAANKCYLPPFLMVISRLYLLFNVSYILLATELLNGCIFSSALASAISAIGSAFKISLTTIVPK